MPTLDSAAVEKALAAGAVAPVYLFYGDDARLVERLAGLVEATIDPADRPFAVERLYAGDEGGSPLDIAAAASVYPMLGDRRIVTVLRAERFLKPKRAQAKADDDASDVEAGDESEAADLAPLEKYLTAEPSRHATLIFAATAIDKSRRLTKQVLAAAVVVECRGFVSKDERGRPFFDRRLAERLAQAELARAGRTIDGEGLALLVDAAGAEISRLQGDIGRLLLYTEGRARIAYADVADIVSSDAGGVIDDWAVVNALGEGNAGLALREIGRRLDRGDSVHAIVGQLRWWVSSKMAQDQPERVKPALGALLRTDVALKSSGGDERVLMERLVVELAGRPVGKRW